MQLMKLCPWREYSWKFPMSQTQKSNFVSLLRRTLGPLYLHIMSTTIFDSHLTIWIWPTALQHHLQETTLLEYSLEMVKIPWKYQLHLLPFQLKLGLSVSTIYLLFQKKARFSVGSFVKFILSTYCIISFVSIEFICTECSEWERFPQYIASWCKMNSVFWICVTCLFFLCCLE